MPHQLVVIGGSAGAVEALAHIVRGLPTDLAAAVAVVVHFPETTTSVLPNILKRSGSLPAAHAVDGQRIEPGRIYVAPPGQHLLVADGHFRLTRGRGRTGPGRPWIRCFARPPRRWGPASSVSYSPAI